MKDAKNILLVLFQTLGWGSIFSKKSSLKELESKTDMELFLSIIKVLTGAHLDEIFSVELYILYCPRFWRRIVIKCFLDIPLLHDIEFLVWTKGSEEISYPSII